jgi:putative salt-induced outer membrane protein YdiY
MPIVKSVVLGVTLALACCGVSRAQDTEPLVQPRQLPAPGIQPPAGPADPQVPLVHPEQLLAPNPPLWHGGLEFGLTGSDGNNDLMNLRLGGNAKRKTDDNIFSVDMSYRYATQNSMVSANRLLLASRDELLFAGTPWSLFVDGSAEYDEFMGYQERIATHIGVGYQFIKTEMTCLKGRLGAGVSKDFSGPTTNFLPEGVVGLDFEQKVTERGKLTAGIEYFPSFESLETYRIISKAAYEWLIDPAWNLTFKVGVLDRYDTSTTPKNPKPNDVEYFAMLAWKF